MYLSLEYHSKMTLPSLISRYDTEAPQVEKPVAQAKEPEKQESTKQTSNDFKPAIET